MFITFWNYGYYGAVFTSNVSLPLFIFSTLFLSTIVYILSLISFFKDNSFYDKIIIDFKKMVAPLSYLLIIISISQPQLTSYIKYDSLLTSEASRIQSLQISKILYNYFPFFGSFKYKSVLLGIDFIILLSFIFFIIMILKFGKKYPIFVATIITITFIIFRTIIFSMGGFGSAQPPFRLFSIWLSSSVFLMSDLSFKLPGIVALILLMSIINSYLVNRTNYIYAWFSGLAIGTIPILWYSATIVEPSIWAALIFSAWLLNTNINKNDFNFFRWFIIIIVGLFLRQSLIIMFVPFILIMIRYKEQSKKFINNNLKNILLILLIWLPFILFSLFQGTGSTNFLNEKNSLLAIQSNIYTSLISGFPIKVFLRDIGIYLLPLFLFAFVTINKKDISNNIITLVSFFCYLLLFLLLPNYGEDAASRYQAEYLVPFILLGYFRLSILINNFFKKSYLLLVIPILIFSTNLYQFINNYRFENAINKTYNSLQFGSVYSCNIFDYEPVFNYLRNREIMDKTIFIGSRNREFSKILAGYTIKDTEKSKALNSSLIIDSMGVSLNNFVASSKSFKYVIIENSSLLNIDNVYDNSFLSSNSIEGDLYENSLIANGFEKDTTFINKDLKSKITVFNYN